MTHYHADHIDDTLDDLADSLLTEATHNSRNSKKKEDKAKAVAVRRALEEHFEQKRWQYQYGGLEHYLPLTL